MAREWDSVAEMFRELDPTGMGTIPRETLERVLALVDFNSSDISVILDKFGATNRDVVKYIDFVEWVKSGGTNGEITQRAERQMHQPFNRALTALTCLQYWQKAATGVSFSTDSYTWGSLQDNPGLSKGAKLKPEVRRVPTFGSVQFGSLRFKSAEAKPFLAEHGLSPEVLDNPNWTMEHADAVAAAVATWAVFRGATMVCHWTQPLRSATSTWRVSEPAKMVHALFNPGEDGRPVPILDASYLLRGEGDSRKFIDITSPMWIRGDTLFIPSVFVNYNNSSFADIDPVICEKTPLLRAMHALSQAGVRFLKNLGHSCSSVVPKIGLEQEFFLVPRGAYNRRLDLQRCGRTLLGAPVAHGTSLYDTHSGPMNSVALACMSDIQKECFRLGIHLRTRHRESAPNQYEFAPYFGVASAQIDENILLMEIIEDIARRHGLVALMHEKPFQGVNGSGKHNNFSISTEDGLNLFNDSHAATITGERLGKHEAFPVIMAAVCNAVYRHGNLIMASVSCPGNEFRLTRGGGCEAPPTCVSLHLGESLTAFLQQFAESSDVLAQPFTARKSKVKLGIPSIDQHGIEVSEEPRNRTAPLPYAGRRFELRSCGSSQNVSLVNTVLCTILAEAFHSFSDKIERGVRPREVASAALKEGGGLKAVYSDNNYSEEWQQESAKRGLKQIESVAEGICQLVTDQSISLFSNLGVMSEKELRERADNMLENYIITVEIEAVCLLEMIAEQVVPAVNAAGLKDHPLLMQLQESVAELKTEFNILHDIEEFEDQAAAARTLRLEKMVAVRRLCDQLEVLVPVSIWPIASFRDLLFDDMAHCKP